MSDVEEVEVRAVKEDIQNNPAFSYLSGRMDKMLIPTLLYFL